MKTCKICYIKKDLNRFHKNKNCKDGVISHCKKCMKEKYIKMKQEKLEIIKNL